MPGGRYPTLFQINTRVWLQRLSREAGRQVTLDDIDDAVLDGFVENGFDWIYLLSVWQTGAAGRAVSCSNPAATTSGGTRRSARMLATARQ